MTGCNLGPAARESSMRCSSSARRLWLVLLPTKQTKLHDEKRLMTDKGTVVSLFLFLGRALASVRLACRFSLRLSFRPCGRPGNLTGALTLNASPEHSPSMPRRGLNAAGTLPRPPGSCSGRTGVRSDLPHAVQSPNRRCGEGASRRLKALRSTHFEVSKRYCV